MTVGTTTDTLTDAKRNIIFSIVLILIFVCQVAFAEVTKTEDEQNPSGPTQFLKKLFNKIEFISGIKTDFDSNIFLAEDDEDSDIINTYTQYISLELPEDPYYLKMDYTGNISYYTEEGDNIYDHSANFILSYRPFDNFSLGIGNYFKKMHSKTITTVFGDRLLSRGYKEDSPMVEAKFEPYENLILDLVWDYYYLDADSPEDDYIDRGDNSVNLSLNYDIWPDLISFIGCRYQDAHFPHLTTKDADSYRGFAGFTKKFKSFNVTTEVGQEHKETNFQGNDANTDFQISLNSTFSVYTMLNLNFTFNRSYPSARSEYFQYFSNGVNLGIWHLINPKTAISANFGYEKQEFDSSDVLSGNSQIDRTTGIYSFSTSVRRNLNDWLSLNLGYEFTKRNTDFAKEGYTDNRVSIGLMASY